MELLSHNLPGVYAMSIATVTPPTVAPTTRTMYKLVSQDMTTHGGMKWEIGVTNTATVEGNKMCTNQVLHCYSDPYLAVLFNPIHADITNPRLLVIECSEIVNTDGLKHASKQQTPVREMELPVMTRNQKVAFGIKCALLVYKGEKFIAWAEKWLSGEDRSYAAAYAASDAAACAAASCAARAAAYAASDAASYAANIGFSDLINWVIANILD